MRKIVIIAFATVVYFIACSKALAQTEPDIRTLPLKERIEYGGNFGAAFGSVTMVNIAPQVGLRLTNRVSAGVGLTYIYQGSKKLNYSYHIGGASIYSRFFVFQSLYLHAECEYLNVPDFIIGIPNVRKNILEVPIGIGYRRAISEKLAINFSVLYNINQTPYSIYSNPIVRIGFGI